MVVKGTKDKEEAEEEEPMVLCSRIPDEDDFNEANHHQIQKEETAFIAKGVKRKRTYECDVCEKRFSQSSNLQTHMRYHTKDKPYECDVCEKCFHTSSNLEVHMRVHTKEKPFECDVCDEAFRQLGHLQTHKRIHTNEKPYECRVCEKRYRRANSLKYHTRTQHY